MRRLERTDRIAYDLCEANRTGKAASILSIESLLKKLVAQVEGATGAIILEADGEAVQWYSVADSERLRLRGAYAGVVLKAFRGVASRGQCGRIESLILEYDRASLVVQEIDGDCFLLLELTPSANIGQALFRLEPTVAELVDEIAP